MKLPGLSIDPSELNPVHCCLCINLGIQGKAVTIVKGYAACAKHSVVLDELGLVDAIAKVKAIPRRGARAT